MSGQEGLKVCIKETEGRSGAVSIRNSPAHPLHKASLLCLKETARKGQ